MGIRIYLLISCMTFGLLAKPQDTVYWKKDYLVCKEDFKAAVPDMAYDRIQRYNFYVQFAMNYQMDLSEFRNTQNFNPYVSAFFLPNMSWMEEGRQTPKILLVANLDFDLAELHARKLRKRVHESIGKEEVWEHFLEEFEAVAYEFRSRQSIIGSELNAQGYTDTVLLKWDQLINKEIEELSDFCITCVPKRDASSAEKPGNLLATPPIAAMTPPLPPQNDNAARMNEVPVMLPTNPSPEEKKTGKKEKDSDKAVLEPKKTIRMQNKWKKTKKSGSK